MSRWLKSVNNLLEQLDGQVGEVIEEGVDLRHGGPTSSSVDDILAKRGLGNEDAEEEHEEEDEESDDETENEDTDSIGQQSDDSLEEQRSQESLQKQAIEAQSTTSSNPDKSQKVNADNLSVSIQQHSEESGSEKTSESEYEKVEFPSLESPSSFTATAEVATEDTNQNDASDNADISKSDETTKDGDDANADEEDINEGGNTSDDQNAGKDVIVDDSVTTTGSQTKESSESSQQPEPTPAIEDVKLVPDNTNQQDHNHQQLQSQLKEQQLQKQQLQKQMQRYQKETKEVTNQMKQSEKETRKLRRNVVNLNSQLESLEHEMSAQSTELKQAAQRMERDRLRHKETLTRLQSEHSNQLEVLRNQFQKDIETVKEDHRLEQVDWSKTLQEAEQARAKEGGSYQEDLQQAIKREQEILQKFIFLQEEKSTLENQVSSLKTQLSTLENSYKSLTITSDTAMEREREAEDKLDAALSLHAKQMGLRLSREQELERTIADLTAALVVEKQKQISLKQPSQHLPLHSSHDEFLLGDEIPSAEDILQSSQPVHTEIQDQLDMIKVQLDIEKLKTSTLQQELKDISQERTEEEAQYLAHQRRNERQMSDVQATIIHLQAQLSHHEKEKEEGNADGAGNFENNNERRELQKQIAHLSEQSMKQQNKIEISHSEISTLNNRLRQAKQRAEIAEDKIKNIDLEAANTSINLNSTVSMYGHNSNHPAKATNFRLKKRRNRKETQSIREAMKTNDIPGLDANESGESIGKIIDILDRWSLEFGKFVFVTIISYYSDSFFIF